MNSIVKEYIEKIYLKKWSSQNINFTGGMNIMDKVFKIYLSIWVFILLAFSYGCRYYYKPQQIQVKSDIIIGLGRIAVAVTVECDEGSSDSANANGIQIIFFSLI